MTAATHAVLASAKPAGVSSGLAAQLTGVAIAALVPALFWVGVIAGAGTMLGYAIPAQALFATGAAIAAFLAAVCAPLMLRTA